MAEATIACSVCGAANKGDATRCVSCGAKLHVLEAIDTSADIGASNKLSQERFEWKWALVAAALQFVIGLVVLLVLPHVIPNFDPQGLSGLAMPMAIAFVVGAATNFLSPHNTFVEPAVGTFFAALPVTLMVMFITPEGFEPSTLAYVVGALISVMLAFLGSIAAGFVRQLRTQST